MTLIHDLKRHITFSAVIIQYVNINIFCLLEYTLHITVHINIEFRLDRKNPSRRILQESKQVIWLTRITVFEL